MPTDKKTGGELFIVDNSEQEWKGLRYLQDWTEIAKAFDIATGFFEIGALLQLDGKWQKLDKIRILMGDQVTARTRQALLDALSANIKGKLDASIENEKEKNEFLTGVPAIVQAMRDKKIECRVYTKRKFHAKAYITHPRLEVVGSVALVGSSNFTVPGLTQNIELNIQVRAAGDVARLQSWFEQHWNDADEITPDIISVIERHIREYTPFEVYARALQELFRSHELTAGEWEQTQSKMYPILDQYQKEGYHSLLKIEKQHRGALLCDGVGLGKTYIGLMLIERLIMFDRKRVMLVVPLSARTPVWERNLKRYLPHLLGDFSNLVIFNHTDLMRKNEFPERLKRMQEMADVILVDEGHHFRNRGLSRESGGSRYWKLFDTIGENKSVFLITATPVNNHLTDFQHLIELFSRDNPRAFATAPLGIHSLAGHFQTLEKALYAKISGQGLGELFETNQSEADRVLFDDKLFRALVVQRSRGYVKKSQIQHGGHSVIFPKRKDPAVVPYSVKKTYGHLLGKVEAAFSKEKQLFSLAVYYPYDYYKGDITKLASFDVNRRKQVVRLIRIQFLKRFESSIFAFESSCQTLLLKLIGFLKVNCETPVEKKRLDRWVAQNSELLEHIKNRRKEVLGDVDETEAEEEDLTDEYLEAFEVLPRKDFKVDEILDETYADMEQIVRFLDELKTFTSAHDDKLKSLIKLLKSDAVLKKHKVIIFSEFLSTARYLKRELTKAGIKGVDEVDSESGRDRGDIIQQFAPYYNGMTSAELAAAKLPETRVLISTDVLSEGLNLQDATRLINYDLHWNPVRLMQRIGRIDRRMDPEVEKKILEDHPDQKEVRGTAAYWNFLPPDDLETLLRLYSRVSHKTIRISTVFGIEGKKLLHPDDDFKALQDFTHSYEGTTTPSEQMHLDYQKLVAENPGIVARLKMLPGKVFSGKEHTAPGTQAVFFCYALPAQDKGTPIAEGVEEAIRWTEDAGYTRWYLFGIADEKIVENPEEIISVIRCAPETPRKVTIPQKSLREIRTKIEKHITNTYLKQVQAPIGVKASLKCWMELN